MGEVIELKAVNVKMLSASAAKQYLTEWGAYTAVRKMHSTETLHYFTAKTYPMGERVILTVERHPISINSYWNISQLHMDDIDEGQWVDAIKRTKDEEEEE